MPDSFTSDVPRSDVPATQPVHAVPALPARGALALGLVLLIAVVAAGVHLRSAAGASGLQPLDDRWLRLMGEPRAGALQNLANSLDVLGGPLGMMVPLAFAGCLCVYGRWRSGLFVFTVAVVASAVVASLLKAVADRPRPPHPSVLVNDGSFPSGQVLAAVAFVIAVAVVAFGPRVRPWWWAFSALYVGAMAWSRTWLHAQWLTDALGGVLAGAGVALILWCAFAPLLRREAIRMAADRLWD
ncbi:phosphatase PAP2 family protein [Streptomyces sp. NPDC048623]|uniref:phosphatase PAP2 family protein n=1 Tax=Streptomyces sp. NPDC048623 TaxID=3155761 RepID=UPI0034285DF9